MKFIFEWKKYFTNELSERVKSFFHEKVNFICSNQRLIFFLLHRYECFEKKKLDEKPRQRKSEGMRSAISSLVRIWKISHSYPGCSFVTFVWKIRVVYFSVKHSYLFNNLQYLLPHLRMLYSSDGTWERRRGLIFHMIK